MQGDFVVVGGKPKQGMSIEELQSQIGIIGLNQRNIQSINEQKILWGPLPATTETEEETIKILKADFTKNIKSTEQIQAVMHQLKRLKMEHYGTFSPDQERVPLPSFTTSEIQAEVEKLKDYAKKVSVSHTMLPSIICYTMHNTYNAVSSIDISPDSSLMATGSADSYIDIWSLKGEKFYDIKASTELATMNFEAIENINELKQTIPHDKKRLIGHSGPVYSTKFSKDNRLLLSGSRDGTGNSFFFFIFSSFVEFGFIY